MKQPTQAEIDQALDLLDWMDLREILRLRAEVSKLVQRAIAASTGHGKQVSTGAPKPWNPVDIALIYVLFMTSDEYLERAMRRESIH